MSGTTLANLPNQPLPPIQNGGVVGPAFVTIWLVVFLTFFGLFDTLSKKRPIWPEFGIIRYASLLLAIYYLFTSVDHWLHYSHSSVPFGYILIYPFAEIFSVISTVLFLWGTFQVIWIELVDRFDPEHQGRWWIAAKAMIFIVSLVSIYYTALFLALTAVWVRFMSLNTIEDIATKRTNFEIAKGAFCFAFSLLVLIASSITFLTRAKRREGKYPTSRILTAWLGTLFLCIRSLIEFILVLMVYSPKLNRQDVALTRNIYYGLLTGLYLICMFFMALVVRRAHDSSGPQSRLIEGALRRHILNLLVAETNNGLNESRRFDLILRDVKTNLPNLLNNLDLFSDPTLVNADKNRYATKYIEQLNRQFGKLDPKEIAKAEEVHSRHQSRTASRVSHRPVGTPMSRLRRNRPSTSTIGSNNTGLQAPPNPDPVPPIPDYVRNFQQGEQRSRPTRIASDSAIPRHPSISSPMRNNGRGFYSGGHEHLNDSMPAIRAIPEEHEMGHSIRFPTTNYRPGPSNVHWHNLGGYSSPDASPLPTQFGGSPVGSAATPYYAGDGSSVLETRYFAGQRTWTNTPENGGVQPGVEAAQFGLAPPITPLTQQHAPSFAERRRAQRRSAS